MSLVAKIRRPEILTLNKEITKCTVILAIVFGAVSLLFFRSNAFFVYGLALGTCAAVANLNILCASIAQSAKKGKKWPVQGGLALRALIYCGAFLLAIYTAGLAGLGAGIGFILPRLAMFYVLKFRRAIREKRGLEPKYVYIADTSSKVFFKEPRFVIDRYNGGKRSYLTHRRFRKVRIEESKANHGS